MERKCIKCGDCCEFLAAGFTPDEIKDDPDFHDRDFILKHWIPAGRPEKKPNPLMSDRAFEGFIWYRCDLFDPETRLCKDYENRPNMCRDCPGSGFMPKDIISARCGFMPGEAKEMIV